MAIYVSGVSNESRIDIDKLVKGCHPSEPVKGPHGEVTVTCQDLTTITQAPNQPIKIYYPIENKTVWVESESGKILRAEGEGWVAEPQSDGRTKFTYVGGEVSFVSPDGTLEKVSADGRTGTVYDTKKCTVKSETKNPDGTKVIKYADPQKSYITVGGYVATTYYGDGSVVFGSGSPSPIDRSKAETEGLKTRIPYGDGNYFIEYKNGTKQIELHEASGKVTLIDFLLFTPDLCNPNQ